MTWLPRLAAVFAFLCLANGARAEEATDWFVMPPSASAAWSEARGGNEVVLTRRGTTASTRTIGVLYSRASPAYDAAIARILQAFAARDAAAVIRLRSMEGRPERAEAAFSALEAAEPALLFTMGSKATAWALDEAAEDGPPIVSVTAKDPVLMGQVADYATGTGRRFALTSLNMPVADQIAYLRALKPSLAHLGILVDADNASAVSTQSDPLAEAAEAAGIDPITIAVSAGSDLTEALSDGVSAARSEMHAGDPTLANSLFWITGSTLLFDQVDTMLEAAGTVPVLATAPELVTSEGPSPVIAIGVGFVSNADLAAQTALRILEEGADPGDLAVGIVSPPDIALNFAEARRIGLRVPFGFLEAAGTVIDGKGHPVRPGPGDS